MCVLAASIAVSLASGLAMRSAAIDNANRTYDSALKSNQSAEQSFAAQQEATAAQLKETRASSAQEALAKTIQGLQARGRQRTSQNISIDSVTARLLEMDTERQAANARESINQSLESATRQYTRNIRGLEADRDNRRNSLQSQINQAYNQIPSLGSILLNTAAQGLNTYAAL